MSIAGCGGAGSGAGTATSSAFIPSTGLSGGSGSSGDASGSAVETRTVTFGASGARGYVPVTVQLGANSSPLYVAPDANDTASFPNTANVAIFLTAPTSYADRSFVKWQWAGQDLGITNTLTTYSTQLTGAGPLVAVYQPLAATAGGFAPNFTRDGFPHWSSFPVTVYLDSTIVPGSSKQTSIINGMNRWVNASGGLISYRLVTDPSQADISVGFGGTPAGLVALTNASWDTNLDLTSATVALNPPVLAANEVSTQNLDTIMAHEFGHALGMVSDTDWTAGHSSDPNDTMYPTGNTAIGLITARDINTMATNYLSLFSGDTSGKSVSTLHGRARRAAAAGTLHHTSVM